MRPLLLLRIKDGGVTGVSPVEGGAAQRSAPQGDDFPPFYFYYLYYLLFFFTPFLVATEADLRKVGTETTTGGWTVTAYYKQTLES